MTRKEYYETITKENSALVVIDHQLGLYTGVRDIPIANEDAKLRALD